LPVGNLQRRKLVNPVSSLLRPLVFAVFALLLLAGCADMGVPTQSAKAVAVDPSEQACLTEAIYFEAGSTNDAGRRAVGEVILNRASDPRFPHSVCGVVKQTYNGSCQFSYRCDGIADDYRSAAVKAASDQMATTLLANRGDDITNGALFFHAAWAAPGWFNTLDKRGQFGGNIFYR
jgi:spore germination cell wall hydrolase CwlJ-like protein